MCKQESKLKASRMHIYVRRGGPNYQRGLAKMRTLGEEIGIPLEVYLYLSKISESSVRVKTTLMMWDNSIKLLL